MVDINEDDVGVDKDKSSINKLERIEHGHFRFSRLHFSRTEAEEKARFNVQQKLQLLLEMIIKQQQSRQ